MVYCCCNYSNGDCIPPFNRERSKISSRCHGGLMVYHWAMASFVRCSLIGRTMSVRKSTSSSIILVFLSPVFCTQFQGKPLLEVGRKIQINCLKEIFLNGRARPTPVPLWRSARVSVSLFDQSPGYATAGCSSALGLGPPNLRWIDAILRTSVQF